jgi:hypothetical protein
VLHTSNGGRLSIRAWTTTTGASSTSRSRLLRRSPRAAAKTAKGRERVAAWLKTLENHSAKRSAADPLGEYDFGWMWQELGVEALRR